MEGSNVNRLSECENVKKEHQEFVHRVSHNFKAPIRHIEWYLNQVLESENTQLDEDSQKNLSSSLAELNQMRAQMDDLLEYSRVYTTDQYSSEINCNDLLSRVLLQLQFDIDECAAKITVDELPSLCGNRNKLENLFFHVLENAIVFRSKERQPVIHVECTVERGHAHFQIKDNGVGIPNKHQAPVFSMFTRAVGEEYPGNGAGLAIARRIVELHKGTISLASPNDSGGTTVHITLPIE